jgi:hypothetical protein
MHSYLRSRRSYNNSENVRVVYKKYYEITIIFFSVQMTNGLINVSQQYNSSIENQMNDKSDLYNTQIKKSI